ncbi:MAG: DEAD/DEAH box helicase family protein [Actinomycetota bacterium]
MTATYADWLSDGPLAAVVREQSDENLRVYATSATRVDEDSGQEMNLAHGGYGKRQLLELVQNGADAMLSAPGGRIHVVLTAEHLYCANEGDAIDEDGIRALLHAHISRKRDAEIGRFGLGFKSVLGVTDRPEFYCRHVSFGFDGAWAKREISTVAPGRERYPSLRLARLLDAPQQAAGDGILAGLMECATTVVRLPRTLGSSEWLSDDIAGFDPAFMLFSPHVGELLLDDRTTGVRREIHLRSEGDDVTITEGADARSWRVFKTTISPSDEAKNEAWELSAREQLPVVWAVPLEGRMTVGRFWAFFPLRDETTLTGIANAPWQINDDRTGLLEGSRLNKELLEALADLVLESIPQLVKEDDPGWILDVIPARGREARCWGDQHLTTRFYELAIDRRILPDQDGQLQCARDLRLSPAEASRDALELWSAAPARPADWCHPSSLSSATRRSRVERLFEGISRKEEPATRWLEALLSPDHSDVDDVAHAVVAASAFIGTEASDGFAHRRAQVQRSRILLDSTGALAEAKPAEIFIPRASMHASSLVRLLHPDLAESPGVADGLSKIGIEELTPALELRAFIRVGLRTESPEEWDTLWTLVRALEDTDASVTLLLAAFRNRTLHVRTIRGSYRPLAETLLPGVIVPDDGSRDADVAVDATYHRAELETLRLLGGEQVPTDGFAIGKDALVEAYRDRCIEDYISALPAGSSTPAWEKMVFDRETHVGPLEPLRHLSDDGRASFVDELIRSINDWRPWTLKHSTQRQYQPRQVPPAAVWAIMEHGRLRSSRGTVLPRRAWGPTFRTWEGIVPVIYLREDVVRRLAIPNAVDELNDEHWRDAFQSALDSTDDAAIGGFYVFAAESHAPVPELIRCRIGVTHADRAVAEVVVTADRDAFRALRDLEQPCLLTTSESGAAALIERWGLTASTMHVHQETQWIESDSPTSLVDTLPTLRAELESAGMSHLELVPCAEIVETVTTDAGTRTIEKDFEREGDRFLWRADLGLDEALRRLREHLPFELEDDEIGELAAGRWKQQRRERLTSIREQPTNEERLLMALGEDRLRTRLSVGLLDAVAEIHGPLAPLDIARLALVVHGDDTLHQFRDDLREIGLEPPDRWAGSREARTFVRDLGFAVEFAGAQSVRLDPELVVLGPPDLPPLHDYQEQIVVEIDNLLNGDEDNRRGLLSLPTGAGKTRVAVQALVHALTAGTLRSPVLWIAPSEELCEQAVQTWSDVWRGLGSMNELRIGRLWGASNEVPEAPAVEQVVVATVDKLRNRVDSPDYAWLAEASCVVIDEAHGAPTPEFTTVLTWLGIKQAGRSTTTRAPLIGLTATPFRGTSLEQTERLVGRFGRRRLDRVFGADDDYEAMYRELQHMGVLSRVDGEELETGTTIDLAHDLSAEERSSFGNLGLPRRFLERIANDVDRNKLLLDSIISRPDDWPILIFAASTEHAHTLAALLTMEGVSAAAIDYRTDPSVRRRYVDRFRRGELRVLTNYNVLTQGFDAPAVRAIFVARPTFSPNTYQQMIGRGSRGWVCSSDLAPLRAVVLA